MGYVSTRKLRLRTQLARIQATLENLYANYLSLSTTENKSYAFDSGEGSQKTTRRDLSSIQTQIDQLEATESRIINELSNMGLISIRLRRKV